MGDKDGTVVTVDYRRRSAPGIGLQGACLTRPMRALLPTSASSALSARRTIKAPPKQRPADGPTSMASDCPLSTAASRQCGSCQLCCSCFPIPAGMIGPGEKPAGVACPHLGDSGCRRYAQRPQLCKDFRCAWHVDASWPDEWRPDRSGLLCLRETLSGGLLAAAVFETRPGALESDLGQQIIAALRQSTSVVATVDIVQQRRCLPGFIAISNSDVARRPAA